MRREEGGGESEIEREKERKRKRKRERERERKEGGGPACRKDGREARVRRKDFPLGVCGDC